MVAPVTGGAISIQCFQLVAIRYRTIHEKEVGDILALDIALKRNDPHSIENFGSEIE
jgi:hypothetical protein